MTRPAPCVAVGLALAAAASFVAPLADDGPAGALAVLALRAAGALALLGGLAVLSRTSLLAKVVASTLAGVLVMACAAVGVVGTVVAGAAEDQAADLAGQAADADQRALLNTLPGLLLPAGQLEAQCQGASLRDCPRFFGQVVGDEPAFLLRLRRNGPSSVLQTRGGFRLDRTEVLGLARLPEVQRQLDGSEREARSALVRLSTGTGRLALVAVAPAARSAPDVPPGSVVVLGLPVTDRLLQRVLSDDEQATFDVSVIAGDPPRVTATNAAPASSGERAGTGHAPARRGPRRRPHPVRPREPSHAEPQPLESPTGEQLGVLAVSRSAREALRSQRAVLAALLGSALASVGLVALLVVPLGRRTVDPVRRLTAAAERLAAGDLTGGTGAVRSRDEVGVLARTFETMTGSLAQLTGDLRSSAARLETVLASMSDGLLSTDGDGPVTSVNRAALEMLRGRRRRRAARAPAGRGRRRARRRRRRLADAGLRVQDAPARGAPRRRHQRSRSASRVTGLRDGGGAGVVLVLRDTTREREVERMKTEFLSNVSHELRTPLTPIRGYADILVSRPGLDADKVTRFAGTILAESLKMNRVVDLLVDVASLEAGRVVLRPVDVDVRGAARRPGRGLARQGPRARRRPPPPGGEPGCRRCTSTPSGSARRSTSSSTTRSSTPPRARPSRWPRRRAPDGERVRVAVRDAGPGIAEADQALLFTSFEQVDGSATRRVGGLGPRAVVRAPGRRRRRAPADRHLAGRAGASEFALDLPAGADRPHRRGGRSVQGREQRGPEPRREVRARSPARRRRRPCRAAAAPPRSRRPRATPTTMRTSRRAAWAAATCAGSSTSSSSPSADGGSTSTSWASTTPSTCSPNCTRAERLVQRGVGERVLRHRASARPAARPRCPSWWRAAARPAAAPRCRPGRTAAAAGPSRPRRRAAPPRTGRPAGRGRGSRSPEQSRRVVPALAEPPALWWSWTDDRTS